MRRLLILVEGQTEERFVEDVLAPHLIVRAVFPIPCIIKTRTSSGMASRGGVTNASHLVGELRRLLHDTTAAVTTLIDYYGLPRSFPGMSTRPFPGDPYSRVRHVEEELARIIDSPRFIPHLTLHEYETWIYSAPRMCVPDIFDEGVARGLEAIRDRSGGPERINESRGTCPSRRLLAIHPTYDKAVHGPLAVAAIGLDSIRQTCPHAAAWLARLESLS